MYRFPTFCLYSLWTIIYFDIGNLCSSAILLASWVSREGFKTYHHIFNVFLTLNGSNCKEYFTENLFKRKKNCARFYWNYPSSVRKGNVYVLCLKRISENNGAENGRNTHAKQMKSLEFFRSDDRKAIAILYELMHFMHQSKTLFFAWN